MRVRKANHPLNESIENLQRRIGLKLKKTRKELGYSNADAFAYDKGINRSQYGKYEAGSQDMRLSSLVRIINAMGMNFQDFFRELE